jgi:cytochrome c553
MTKAEIVSSLNGYKNGTYGGASKNIMLPQVKDLSDNDIKEISELIGK